MLEKCEGIVLRAIKCANGTTILDIYSSSMGRAQFSSGRRERSCRGGTGVLCMPLSVVSMEYEYRPKDSIQRLKEWKLDYAPAELPFHPLKGAIALFVAELLTRVLHEQEANRGLYDYLRQSIVTLDRCSKGIANYHLVFMMQLACYLGIFPNLTHYEEGIGFHLQEAEFLPLPLTPNAYHLHPDEAKALHELVRMNYQNMGLFAMNRLQRNRCLSLMLEYYQLHLPGMGSLKSVEVLQQLFAD